MAGNFGTDEFEIEMFSVDRYRSEMLRNRATIDLAVNSSRKFAGDSILQLTRRRCGNALRKLIYNCAVKSRRDLHFTASVNLHGKKRAVTARIYVLLNVVTSQIDSYGYHKTINNGNFIILYYIYKERESS